MPTNLVSDVCRRNLPTRSAGPLATDDSLHSKRDFAGEKGFATREDFSIDPSLRIPPD